MTKKLSKNTENENKEESKQISSKEIESIKQEVLTYAKDRIGLEVQASVKKVEKKLIRQKNRKIIRRDIFILILLAIIGFMGYEMYRNGYLDKYITKEKEVIKEVIKEKEDEEDKENSSNEEEEKEPEKDLTFHEVALDNYYVGIHSDYLENYYNGNLTNELLLSLTLNRLDESCIIDDETFMVDSFDLEQEFNLLFEDMTYKPKSFKYNGKSIKYLKASNTYISIDDIDIKDSTSIKRVVDNITEEDDIVTINTIEAVVKDNKIYNVLTDEEVGKYKNDESIINKKDELNKLEYKFIYENDEYRLISIKKL